MWFKFAHSFKNGFAKVWLPINTNSNVSFYSDINKVQDKKFDIIIFMDVLEHVANDSEFLAYYKKFLNEGGVIIISVPAYQKLFSVHDVALKHFRRYSREKLQKTIIKAGYKINYMSDFYASLLFARFFMNHAHVFTPKNTHRNESMGNLFSHADVAIYTTTLTMTLSLIHGEKCQELRSIVKVSMDITNPKGRHHCIVLDISNESLRSFQLVKHKRSYALL